MGSLWNFDFSDEFVREFPIFVETGYGTGHGVEHASRYGFERIYSIEMYLPAAKRGREKFAHDPRVEIIEASSVEGITTVLLHRRPKVAEGVFLWLDAHFPGADYCNEPWDAHPLSTRLPLEGELATIWESGRYCAILADDLNYYADLPYQHNLVPPWRAVRPIDFLTPFTATHSVQIVLNDKGYALIVPLGAPSPRMMTTEK